MLVVAIEVIKFMTFFETKTSETDWVDKFVKGNQQTRLYFFRLNKV